MKAGKSTTFWSIAAVITLLDFITKQIAEAKLERGQTIEGLGRFLRFTLGYHTGIAFGFSVGGSSRWLLIQVTVLTRGLIFWLYRSVAAQHKLQVMAFGLIM